MKKFSGFSSYGLVLFFYMFPAVGLGFSSTVGYWSVFGGRITNGVLTVLLEHEEASYQKNLGDLLLAGRGRLISERKVYGKLSFSLTSQSRNTVRITPLVQRSGGSRLQVGFSCDSDHEFFLCEEQKTLGWITNGKVQRVGLGEREYLPKVCSRQGRILFRGGNKLLEYGVAKRDWYAVGVIPSGLRSNVQVDSDLSVEHVQVCEDLNVLCSAGNNGILNIYSLETGKEYSTVRSPAGATFMNLAGFETPAYAVFGHASGTIQFLGIGGHPNFKVIFPAPLFFGPVGTSVTVPICSDSPGILIVDAYNTADKQGTIRIWIARVDGRTSEVWQQVDFSPPNRNLPEF